MIYKLTPAKTFVQCGTNIGIVRKCQEKNPAVGSTKSRSFQPIAFTLKTAFPAWTETALGRAAELCYTAEQIRLINPIFA